jgi:hypothetical protein
VGVRSDQKSLVDARGSVEDRGGAVQAMLDAEVSGSQGHGFVEWHDAMMQRLGHEAIGNAPASMLGEMFVNLEDHQRRNEHGGFRLEVMSESGCLGVFGEVLEPAGRVHDEKVRSGPRGHGSLLSSACPWRCREVLSPDGAG